VSANEVSGSSRPPAYRADHRMSELDGIRGVACLVVLFDHCVIGLFPPGWIPGYYRLTAWLLGGVDLFFVLSGLLIGGILLDHRSAANYFKVFWTRRVARIMPVYYLLLLTFYAALLAKPLLTAPWLDGYLFKDMMPLWTYPLFVQNFAQSVDGGDGGARWVASTWSLAIEEQFYLLLPPLVYVMGRRRLAVLAAACIAVAPLVRGHLWQVTGHWAAGYFLLPGRMDSLMFGLLGALTLRTAPAIAALRRHRRSLDLLSLALVVALSGNVLPAIGAMMPNTVSFPVRSLDFTLRSALFYYAIMRVFLVGECTLYRRVLSSRPLVGAGTISYALYMYHPVVNGLLHGALFADDPRITDVPRFLAALAVMAISVGLAWLSTTYFELPIRRLSHRVKYRRETGPGALPG